MRSGVAMSFSALRLGVLNRHKPCVVTCGGARSADVGGQPIERQALGAGDGGARHVYPATIGQVMGVGGEKEQQPCRAGVKVSARRLVAWREAVRFQCDKGQSGIECGAGDLLFSEADAWRHEYCPALGRVEEPRLLCGQRIGRNAARALNLQTVGAVEQKRVAVGGVGASCNRQGVETREVVGVCTAHGQAAWVVADVVEKGFQLAAVSENAVVVARGEERRRHVWRRTGPAAAPFGGHSGAFQRVMARWHFGTYLRQGCGHTAHRHFGVSQRGHFAPSLWSDCARDVRQQVRCRAIYGAISLGTPGLEASHHHTQVVRHGAAHEQQPVKMVWHHGAFQQLHVGVEARNLPPAVGHGFAERREGDLFANELSQQRPASLHFKSDHVDSSAGIVVAEASAFHGMDDGLFHTWGIIGHRNGGCKPDAKNGTHFSKGGNR